MAYVLLHSYINKATGMETTITRMHDNNIAMGPLSLYIVWGYRINDSSYRLELAQSSVLFEAFRGNFPPRQVLTSIAIHCK